MPVKTAEPLTARSRIDPSSALHSSRSLATRRRADGCAEISAQKESGNLPNDFTESALYPRMAREDDRRT